MQLERSSQEHTRKSYQESAGFVSEAVAAIRNVSSLGLEGQILAKYCEKVQASVQNSYKYSFMSMILFALSESLDLAISGLAFCYGAKLLSEGEYGTQAFFIVFVVTVFGSQTAGVLLGFTLSTTKAHLAANRIIDLRNSRRPINTSKGIHPKEPLSEKDTLISFIAVRFAYPALPNIPVLRGLSLSIQRGQSVGIVGPSGGGKTTVIALLERFYDIQSGSIRIYGSELRQLDVHAHRARIGMVSQEPTVYQVDPRKCSHGFGNP